MSAAQVTLRNNQDLVSESNPLPVTMASGSASGAATSDNQVTIIAQLDELLAQGEYKTVRLDEVSDTLFYVGKAQVGKVDADANWLIIRYTTTDDYATGTLLDTLTTNTEVFRFIGISGFDIVGRDVSSGVRRRTSMLKGSYTQAFYVGNQIQLATDAPQLIENNEKLDELILKIDTQKKPLTLPQYIALK